MAQDFDPEEFGAVPLSTDGEKDLDFTPEEFGAVPFTPQEKAGFLEGVDRGLARGVAGVAGAPVDLIGAGFNAITSSLNTDLSRAQRAFGINDPVQIPQVPENPFGGAQSVERGFNTLGIPTRTAEERRSRASDIGGVAGEVIGGSAIPAGIPGAIVKARGAVGPITRAFERAPGAFSTVEAGAALGSAQAAAAAEALAPGNQGLRFTGEVAGGFLNPFALTTRTGRGAVSAAASLTSKGREARAAKVLENAVIQAGEDPAVVARALDAADLQGVSLTSAIKSGSSGLLALEKKVAQVSPKFGDASGAQALDSLENLRSSLTALTSTGDPAALRAAARGRQEYFSHLISTRVKNAELNALNASRRLATRPGTKAEASEKTYQTLQDAAGELREVSRELWADIPKDVAVPTNRFGAAVQDARTRLLDTEGLPVPAAISRAIDDAVEQGSVTSGDLLKLRNRLLNQARISRSQQDFSSAEMLNSIADGALDDLSTLSDPSVGTARQFTKLFYDHFSRGFAGSVDSVNRQGAERVAPEVLLDKAFAGSGSASARRFKDLEDAASLADFPGTSLLLRDTVRNEQERFLRAAASNVLEEGVANPTKLRTFIRNNADLLERFPGLASDLSNAETASRVLKGVQKAATKADKIILGKAAFSRLVGTDNVDVVVDRALANPARSQENLRQLAKLARRGGKASREGLQTAVFDSVFKRNTSGGTLDFEGVLQSLDTKATPSAKSLSSQLQNTGILTKTQLDALRKISRRGAQIQKNLADASAPEDLNLQVDGLTDFIVRVGGARLGAQFAQGPSTLVAAGAGSRFLRNQLEKIPASRTQDVLIEAARNPAFASTLLKKARNKGHKRQLERQINAFLIQAVIIDREDDR